MKNSKTLIPAEISEENSKEIQKLAIKAFKAISGRGLSRVDFFIEDKTLKQRVLNIYKKLDLPQVPNYDTSTLLEYVTHDKKSSHNTVSTVLVEQSGSYIIKELSFKEIQEVLERGPYEK